MADTAFYGNALKDLLSNPGSFQGTPGFQFALDQGLGAVNRSNSRMRGSGNALAALTNYASGLATQDYGNQVDRLGRLQGQEQQYDLGQESNRLTGARDANNFTLGSQQNANTLRLGLGQNENAATANANTAQRNAWDYSLGRQQNQNTANANDQQFGLGMYNANNNFALGSQQNQNTANNNWWNYQLGGQQNANTAANNQNNYNLGTGRNAIDWYNAGTNRGQAQSNAWLGAQRLPLGGGY